MVEDGVPMLMICGLYQLFGHHFETREAGRSKASVRWM